MPHTQDNRTIAIETPLGKDVLLLHGFAAQEAISRLFRISAELLSENASIDFTKIIGKQVTISLRLADGSKRYFNGHVSRFAQTGMDDRFTHYHAEIVPWLWFLTRRADCRIFQNMTIPDIVAKIFKDGGFGDFRNSLQGSFEQREYCVQYRETDFNFVSRLMEQYGIFYFFEHEQNKHTLVMGNKPAVHKPCPGQSKARMNFAAGAYIKDEDVVGSWNLEQELRPGKYALTDYNFETPSTSLLSSENTIFKVGGNDSYEVFDYPGEYTKKSEGESRTQIRMQEEETVHLIGMGAGGCRTFVSGYRFDLSGHSRSDQNQTYLLTEVQHSASVGGGYSGSGEESEEHYSNHFQCIPYSVPYRPQRHTPRPFVQGPQTAVVTGKSGEEIWTDKYGRVKVQFFWDREGKKDEKSSCWVRVSQPWAGKNWGAINIPRIGQEVIVEFLEGDPDRPLITGRVYNDEQMPPYKLADNQTRTTFLTRSTKGGGSSNFNELRFEDKKGDEQIFMNAEKDMDWRVENDSREYVGKDRSLIVKGDQKEKVEGDKNGHFLKNMNEKIGQNMSLDIGQSLNEKTGMKFAHEAGQEIHLKAGMNVVIEAGLELTIKASGGFINIGPAGVAISGTPLVLINSGGAAGSGSGSSPTSPTDPDEADDGSKGGKM
ncbi:MAG: type VI secretion system tip protein VgrG [Candidatus Acidiferrum sp.]